VDYSSKPETLEHISNVDENIKYIIAELQDRALHHDQSKLELMEMETFDKYTPKLKGTTYGSEEYKTYLKEMQVALDHHYEYNKHHPEHYENGINDMTLIDLIEMFCDWKAAVKRHADGDIYKSIEINSKRFNISDQLTQILKNTVDEFLI